MIVHHKIPEKCNVLKDQAGEALRTKANRRFSAAKGPETQENATFRKERIRVSRANAHSNPNPRVRISYVGAPTTQRQFLARKDGWVHCGPRVSPNDPPSPDRLPHHDYWVLHK